MVIAMLMMLLLMMKVDVHIGVRHDNDDRSDDRYGDHDNEEHCCDDGDFVYEYDEVMTTVLMMTVMALMVLHDIGEGEE